MQCCGAPFAVGSVIQWTVVTADVDYLAAVLGSAADAAEVTDAEEHHSDGNEALTRVAGTVQSIIAVHCAYGGNGYPLPGTARVESKTGADGWEPELSGRAFVGYVVELDDGTVASA